MIDLEVLGKGKYIEIDTDKADLPDFAVLVVSVGQGNGKSSELELLIRGVDT